MNSNVNETFDHTRCKEHCEDSTIRANINPPLNKETEFWEIKSQIKLNDGAIMQ